jgi:AAA15 family ATPase/GTPase
MIAGSYTDHLENTIEVERYKIRVLKTSVIYGANASGKSNLLKAITYGARFVQVSFSNSQATNHLPFFFNKNEVINVTKPTTFCYGILIDGIHFEYSFSIGDDRIFEEQLLEYRSQKPIQHFFRVYIPEKKEYEWHFSKLFVGEKETVKNITNERALYLTVGSQTNIPIAVKVVKWFSANNLMWSIDDDYPGNLNPDYTLRMIKNSPQTKEVILNFVRKADFTITDLNISESENVLKATTIHKIKNVDGTYSDGFFDLKFDESAGTKRFIAWIGVWIDILSNGKTLIIDELGNSMHSLLLRHLISEFHERNLLKSQLIFTTHDTNLMTQDVFRRDQIWIVDRDSVGNSNLYPMSDFKIKKGKVLENSYFQGVYGGIPQIVD